MTTSQDISHWCLSDPAWIAREGAIPEHTTEDDGSLFPDGTRAVECTNWARYARRIYGPRVKIFGFSCDDNPAATGMKLLADGHDFALLDDRYILDGWLANVEYEIEEPLLDTKDPQATSLVELFYGDPDSWEHMIEMEQRIDSETPEQRHIAMQGVAPAEK